MQYLSAFTYLGEAPHWSMFMVGGGILVHGWPALQHGIEQLALPLAAVPGIGALLAAVAPTLLDALAGVAAGALVLLLVTLALRAKKALRG